MPPPLSPQGLSADDIWGITPIDRGACIARIRTLRNDGFFTPPSLQGSVEFPFYGGGSNWGGMGYDPSAHLAILNSVNVMSYVLLFPSGDFARLRKQGVAP